MKIILSISGGGIRGIIPAIILAEIEKRLDKPLVSYCDVISGTSTGGIIACLLCTPNDTSNDINNKYCTTDIVSMYKEFGKKVFKRNLIRKIFSIGGLIGTKYNHKILESLLKEYFGKYTKLSDVNTNLLIPAYQITNNPYPHFFKTKYARNIESDIDNPYLWECARSTSAANGYFKPYKYNDNNTFLDGGVFANNPTMCAFSEAERLFTSDEKKIVISIGTGENLKGYNYNTIKNWGMIQWALPFFKHTSISADATVDYMLRTFENDNMNYFKIQANLDKDSLKMDDASTENLLRLENSAKQAILDNDKLIDKIVELLKSK